MSFLVKLNVLLSVFSFPTSSAIPNKITLDIENLEWPAQRNRAAEVRSEFSPDKNVVWNVEIWRDRVFYCIPRWTDGVVATLVSANWTSKTESEPPLLHPFPNWAYQSPGEDCHGFQSVTAVAADILGRLWVMDAGNDVGCPPKIVVFDLIEEELSGKEIARHNVKIPGVSGKDLLHMVVDWGAGAKRGPRAYASDAGGGSILVYSLNENACWKVYTGVTRGVGDMSVSYFYLALFFVTKEESDELFQVDLVALRQRPPTHLDKAEVSAVKVGKLSGNTTTVAADKRGGIIYYVPKTNAVMRWDTIGPLEAEWHDLLYLNGTALPKVPRIVFDSDNSGWALANTFQGKSNVTSTLTRIYDPLM